MFTCIQERIWRPQRLGPHVTFTPPPWPGTACVQLWLGCLHSPAWRVCVQATLAVLHQNVLPCVTAPGLNWVITKVCQAQIEAMLDDVKKEASRIRNGGQMLPHINCSVTVSNLRFCIEALKWSGA